MYLWLLSQALIILIIYAYSCILSIFGAIIYFSCFNNGKFGYFDQS